MGQLEKYGLYVLCLVIFLILGVAIWGGEPEPVGLPNENLPLHGAAGAAGGDGGSEEEPTTPAPRYSSAADLVQNLLKPVEPPRQGRNLPPPEVDLRDRNPAPAVETDLQRTVSEASGPRVYTVKKGDILGEIAQRELGSSRHWKAIVALNPGLDPKKLKPGQELLLPDPAAESVADPDGGQAAWRWHTVEKGESFYVISKKLYGTVGMMDDIKRLNPKVNPRRLREGMEIKVPITR